MKLKVHVPVPDNIRSREEKLKNSVPKASSLLTSIRSRTDRYKYGISDREINRYYRFSDQTNTQSFFEQRFKQFGKNYIDDDDIKIDITNSVNTIDPKLPNLKPTERFRRRAELFSAELVEARSRNVPFVSILTGPTGSGKTAYSKCLFNAGVRQFWDNNIVPTRVEFTKFFKAGQELSAQQVLESIHRCQVRDLLIYLCLRNPHAPQNDDFDKVIPRDGKYSSYNAKFRKFAALTENHCIDGENYTLGDAHRIWKVHVNYFPHEVCEEILSNVKPPELDIQFLVSLDGFDALKTKDFLVSDRYHGPISAVADLLGHALNQVADYGGSAASHNTNLMVFMRDTTYSRIKLELSHTPNGVREIPVRWIVPPSYKILADTVSAAINMDIESSSAAVDVQEFVANIRNSIEGVLKGTSVGLSVEQPISSAFSWNARHMKRHIRRICMWSLENYVQANASLVEERLNKAGVSVAWLWQKAITNPALKRMAEYSVLEAFFLDDTKCLQSKFRLRSKDISDYLADLEDSPSDLPGALGSIEERPELEGLFDSITNYLTKGSDSDENGCRPHLLISVRIMQILKSEKALTIEDIFERIENFYQNVSLEEVRFYIVCLCENEYVVFEGVENSSNLDECHFYLTNFGAILINKVLFSTTYISQSLMVSELTRDGLGRHFKERNFRSNEDWVAHCVCNAIIGYNIVREAEAGELSTPPNFILADKLRSSIVSEASRIFANRRSNGRLEWQFVNTPEYLKEISKEQKDFDPLQEIWT